MDENQFRHLLKLGLGRAILYARDHDVQDFRKLILDACLHCYAYDPQIEGTRASYMLDLLDLMPDKEFYYDKVLNALSASGDNYDAVQRFHLAACLALEGNERAKRLMYGSYNPGPRMGEAIAIDFLQMDGVKGLLFAAEKIGALLMSVAGESLGEQAARDALRKAGAENPRIEAYRLAEEASRKRFDEWLSKSAEMINATYEELRPGLHHMSFTWLTSWGERASDEDLVRAARGLAAARDHRDQFAHLRIFARRRFPLDIQLLLSLADVQEERVAQSALKALSQITHPAVRRLAFRLVETRSQWRGKAVELLERNFQTGDHAIVLHWFEAEEELDTRHALGLDFFDFWEQHPHEETEVPMLLALYERGPCSFCRESAVRRLIELGKLTDERRLECSYDANGDIRDLAKGPSPMAPQG